MGYYVGSTHTLDLPFVRVEVDGTAYQMPLTDPSAVSARIVKPDGTEVTITPDDGLTITDADAGEAEWTGELDQPGVWVAQGTVDGVLSDYVTWRVWPVP